MFGKKPSAPPPAQSKPQAPAQPQPQAAARPSGWAAQALTADYLASGYLQPVDMPLAGFLNVSTQATITLTGVQLQAVGAQAAIVNPAPAEITIPKTALIAFIPRDEPGMRSATQQMPNRPAPAVIYAGPYLIRAAFMLPGDMPLRNFFGTAGGTLVAVTQAEITCQVPGAKFTPLKAQIVVLNKALVQMYHPA
ncbi:MAG TPA: hypothetical protein VI793_07810 [Anaerolineales bacterium]|nr:hypothetical protein [Anaerolineales bacterium]